ncbi:MAG: selenium metabolism-associated LysR family transcriptional regulator [Thermovenabulum sp.]|uniref:selenium metabolism-associated LysR family transcriptional regulator n=1 Tax=Thermovenabulum sp. TaxID=3100335 RepID=UPI003C7E82C9
MNVNLLKTFVTVTECGTLSKAAEKLFVTQPALSQQIKQLENYFSVQLIERTNKGINLTEAGKILYHYASKVVKLCEDLEKEMDTLRLSISGLLVVGATSAIGGYAVPCSIFIFKEKYPEANIKLRVGNKRQVEEELKNGLIDVAVIEGKRPKGEIITEEIATEELLVIAPNNDCWSNKSSITLEEFLKEPLIMREQGSGTREIIKETFESLGIKISDLNVVMELSSIDSIKAAVEAGHGISIMPAIALKKELYNKTLVALKIEGVNIQQKIYVAYKEDKLKNKLAKAFIHFMRLPSRGFC